MTRAAAETEDALERENRVELTGEQHEKANHQIHALQGLPQPRQVQGDGVVHDEGR
jgi:hypothetical protein